MRFLIYPILIGSFILQCGADPVIGKSKVSAAGERVAPPLLQTQVKGLLVVELPDGSHAGTATQMNATAVRLGGVDGFELRFNQSVGPMMKGATKEVSKLMQVRHEGALPKGYAIEFGFADKYTMKDGPSAAVACGLMANAIITGKPLDQAFAATGDMTATGEVRPVGGVGAKIKGASRKNCTIFSVPEANADAVADLYITDGLESVAGIQIVAVGSFDEALAIGTAEKSEEIQAALADYEMVQKAVLKNQGNAGHPKVQEKLRAVLKAIPGHQSARLVALHGQGRGPSTLSLPGSLVAIENGAQKFSKLLGDGNLRSSEGLGDPLRDTVFNLTRIEKNVDPRTKGLLRAYIKVAYFFKDRRQKKYLSDGERGQLEALLANLNTQRDKLRNNKEVQEEFLDE
ncbi:S16 family serine protease [Verrucomicrobiaceae bacterium 227]